jgi:pimeloyl-ACP methyl ester carboxylesterase
MPLNTPNLSFVHIIVFLNAKSPSMSRTPYLLPILVAIASVDAATQSCSLATFTFPPLFGAELRAITANEVRGYKANPNQTVEALEIGSEGVDLCNVTVTYTHPNTSDETNVQVWLPLSSWNERFIGVGGGGFSTGELGGDPISSLVYQGYAAATTDGGHDYRNFLTAPWALVSPGNVDWNLLVNYAYRSLHDMAVIGKAITRQYFGMEAKYTYWNGCSTGGRQGLVVAQRYPEDYDGILAACPAINLPKLGVGGYWVQLVMSRLGEFPPACQLDAVVNEAIAACDELDGLKDGVVAWPDSCDFEPGTVVGRPFSCNGSPDTISAAAAKVAKAAWSGAISSAGEQISFGYPVGTPLTGTIALANTVCADGKCTGSPFPIAVDWIRLFVAKDPNFDFQNITFQSFEALMHKSIQEYDGIIGSHDSDLSELKRLGKKMITWHGINDELLTVRSTREYYEAAMAGDGDLMDYYRYFEVPGANHCHAGEGIAYPLHALDVLRRWVEHGVVPEVLDAVRLGDDGGDGVIVGPLCPYPLVADNKKAKVGIARCFQRPGSTLGERVGSSVVLSA